jgi:hypothetical protein
MKRILVVLQDKKGNLICKRYHWISRVPCINEKISFFMDRKTGVMLSPLPVLEVIHHVGLLFDTATVYLLFGDTESVLGKDFYTSPNEYGWKKIGEKI